MGFYKELRMGQAAFMALRDKIQDGLETEPEMSGGGEITAVRICPDTGGLLITAQYDSGQRTHLLTLSEVDE